MSEAAAKMSQPDRRHQVAGAGPAAVDPTDGLLVRLGRTALAERHRSAPGAVAVAVGRMLHPAVAGAIAGLRRPGQSDPLPVVVGLELSDEELDEIEGRH